MASSLEVRPPGGEVGIHAQPPEVSGGAVVGSPDRSCRADETNRNDPIDDMRATSANVGLTPRFSKEGPVPTRVRRPPSVARTHCRGEELGPERGADSREDDR